MVSVHRFCLCHCLQDSGSFHVLSNTHSILDELESHQMALEALLGDGTGIVGSFVDDIVQWQTILRHVETVIRLWTAAQDKWTQLEQVFNAWRPVTWSILMLHTVIHTVRDLSEIVHYIPLSIQLNTVFHPFHISFHNFFDTCFVCILWFNFSSCERRLYLICLHSSCAISPFGYKTINLSYFTYFTRCS